MDGEESSHRTMTAHVSQRTPFYADHRARGARMVDFAGWEMPVQFSSVITEHRAVREKAGLFDISHMGQIWVVGPDARSFLNRLVTNDVGALAPGRGLYALLCKPDGCVVDDWYIYCLEAERFLVIANASRVTADLAWVRSQLSGDVMLIEQPLAAAVALQGPEAERIMRLFSADAALMKKNDVRELTLFDVDFIVARTGYTGEDGFEIFAPAGHLIPWYTQLFKKGADLGLLPCGLGARDTLRLEMGYRLYGQDLDEQHSALESGLGWVIKWEKGDFIGRDALSREREKGSFRWFVSVVLQERGVPRSGSPILLSGRPIGEVTSGTFSPSLNTGIAMGYVERAAWMEGGPMAVRLHGRDVPAVIAMTPFYKKKSKHS